MIEPPVFQGKPTGLYRDLEPDYLSPEYLAAARCYVQPESKEKPIMKIEFDIEASSLVLTFSMVPPGGLFVAWDGCLCQRDSNDDNDSSDDCHQAWQICTHDGEVEAGGLTFTLHEEIKRILPKIKRIQF